MAFISNNNTKVGDWVFTKKEHRSMSGVFTIGSLVQITDIDPVRGYTIEDKQGNKMIEIGWTI